MSIIRKLVHLITFIISFIFVLLKSILTLIALPFFLLGYAFMNGVVRIQAHYLKKFVSIQTYIYNKILLYYGSKAICLKLELTKNENRTEPGSTV